MYQTQKLMFISSCLLKEDQHLMTDLNILIHSLGPFSKTLVYLRLVTSTLRLTLKLCHSDLK